MELNDYVTIMISSIALIISVITMIRARNTTVIATKQSHIDIKYKALSLAQIQQTTMLRLRQRIEVLISLSKKELTDAVSSMHTQIGNLLESSDERMKWLSSLDSDKVSTNDELEIRKTLGLLKERDAILISTEHQIERAEKASRQLLESTAN